jgi:transcriptional regulator with XRE-family HTH domain
MKISQKIRILMALFEITNKEMADKLNITPQRLSNYLADVSRPPMEFVQQISEMFNVSIDYLVNEKYEFSVIYRNKHTHEISTPDIKENQIAEPSAEYSTEMAKKIVSEIKILPPESLKTLLKIIEALKEEKSNA